MTDATIRVAGAERAVRPTPARQGRRLHWRHLWIVPGLAIAILGSELGKTQGVGILMLIAFGLAPDIPRLFGIRRRGTGLADLPRRAHNVLHHPATPAAAVVVAWTGIVPPILLVGSLVWLGHVVIGFGVGDVPRHPAKEPADA